MVPFRFGLGALLCGSLLALAAPVQAQPWPYTYTSPYTSVGPVAAGPLSGYTGKFPTPLPPYVGATAPAGAAGPAVMTPGTTTLTAGGVGNYYYSPSAFEAYSPVLEPRSAVLMTTINYPGLYGSVFGSVSSVAYNVRPSASNFYTASQTETLAPRTVTITPTMRAVVTPEPAATPETTARLNVLVPAEATLTIQGVPMTSRGGYREFVSPPLVPGEDYTYDLRASWNQDGRDVVRTERVVVRAGGKVEVDLMRNRAPSEPTLRTRPLP